MKRANPRHLPLLNGTQKKKKRRHSSAANKQTNSNNNNKQPVVCLWSNKKHRKGKTKTLGGNSQSSRKRVEKQKEAHEGNKKD